MTFRKHLAVFLSLTLGLVCCYTPPAFATVSNTTVSTTTALGDGVTTNFVIGFDFRSNSWVNVVLHDNVDNSNTTIAQGSGAGKFTVSGGNPGTTVVMGTAPTATQYLVITRNIPLTQTVAFSPAGVFPYSGLSSQLDQVTLSLQNLNAGIGSSSGGGGGAVGGSTLPSTGVAYDFIGWNSAGTSTVNYPGSTVTLSTNDVLKYTGSGWTNYNLSGSNIASLIDGQTATQIAGSAGGTGVNNGGNLTYGSHNLTFTLSGDTSLTLPTSGTVLTGTTNTGNVAGTLVLRDGSGNFSSNQITANTFVGALTGDVTGNLTGNASGTALSVTGTTPIGHGGTGQTTQQLAINALTGSQTSGYFLRSDGTNASLQPIGIGDVPQGFSRLKLAQDTANTLVINDGSGNMSVLPGINSGDVLMYNGIRWVDASAATVFGSNGVIIYGAESGTANHYVVTPASAITSYSVGMTIAFVAGNANTTVSDVNVSGVGVVSLTEEGGGNTTQGDILSGQVVHATYDGTKFQMISQQGPGVSTITANALVKRDTTGSVLGHASLDLRATNNLSDVASIQTAMNNVAQAVTSGFYLRGDGTNVQMSALKAADMTGQIAIANGGTGQSTQQLAIDALAGAVTSGQYLRGNGTHVTMSAISASDVPTLNQNTTGTAANVTGIVAVANGGTSLSTLTLNNVIMGNGSSAPLFVAPSTNGNVLTSNGTTWTSSAPGGAVLTWLTKTANYTMATSDTAVLGNSTVAFTLTLPGASTVSIKEFYIKNINTGVVTIKPLPPDVLDGETTQLLNQYGGVIIISDGSSHWYAF